MAADKRNREVHKGASMRVNTLKPYSEWFVFWVRADGNMFSFSFANDSFSCTGYDAMMRLKISRRELFSAIRELGE